MNGGIFALATRKPLSSPQAQPGDQRGDQPDQDHAPARRRRRSFISLAATTPEKTSTEPTDRSMPR